MPAFLTFLLWLVAMAAPTTALRAEKTSADVSPREIATVLSRNLEDRAKAALERYIPLREFEVTVSVTPSNKTIPRTPYEPKATTLTTLSQRPAEDLQAYISRIDVSLSITNRLVPSRKKLEEILAKSLMLSTARGDKLSVSQLGIDVESDEFRRDKSNLQQQLQTMKAETDRLNRELAVAEQTLKAQELELKRKDKENDRAEQALRDKERQTREIQSKANEANPIDWDSIRYTLMGLAGAALFLLLVGILIFGRTLANAGKNLGGALSAIAGAMEVANNRSGDGGTQSLEAKMITEGGGGDPNRSHHSSDSNISLASLPIDSINAHLLKVRKELTDGLTESSESIILRHLTQLCITPENVERAVVAMELLGKDVATEMFRKLGTATQEAIMNFLHTGIYRRSKMELMLESGEELKTKLLVESLDKVRGRSNEKIAERILQLGPDELCKVAAALDPELLARFFVYLDAAKLAVLFSALKKTDDKTFSRAVTVLNQLPNAERAASRDVDIITTIDGVIEQFNSDIQRPFLKIYKDIVEATDEEVGETIVKELSTDPRLETFFRENVINVHTFFRLKAEARTEIVETLSNREVAALGWGADENERDLLFNELPDRRRSLVDEEFETIQSRGERAAEQQYKKVKETIVRKLKDMKLAGTLTAALGEPTESETSEEGEIEESGEEQEFEEEGNEDEDDDAA